VSLSVYYLFNNIVCCCCCCCCWWCCCLLQLEANRGIHRPSVWSILQRWEWTQSQEHQRQPCSLLSLLYITIRPRVCQSFRLRLTPPPFHLMASISFRQSFLLQLAPPLYHHYHYSNSSRPYIIFQPWTMDMSIIFTMTRPTLYYLMASIT